MKSDRKRKKNWIHFFLRSFFFIIDRCIFFNCKYTLNPGYIIIIKYYYFSLQKIHVLEAKAVLLEIFETEE